MEEQTADRRIDDPRSSPSHELCEVLGQRPAECLFATTAEDRCRRPRQNRRCRRRSKQAIDADDHRPGITRSSSTSDGASPPSTGSRHCRGCCSTPKTSSASRCYAIPGEGSSDATTRWRDCASVKPLELFKRAIDRRPAVSALAARCYRRSTEPVAFGAGDRARRGPPRRRRTKRQIGAPVSHRPAPASGRRGRAALAASGAVGGRSAVEGGVWRLVGGAGTSSSGTAPSTTPGECARACSPTRCPTSRRRRRHRALFQTVGNFKGC